MVVEPLEPERGPARPRDLGAAGAAAAVRGEDRDVVREVQHPVTQCVVCRARELFLELRTEEVNARDVSNEERAA